MIVYYNILKDLEVRGLATGGEELERDELKSRVAI